MNKTEITAYWQELPWNEFKLKANKHLPKFIFILLIILITQTFAKLTWDIFAPAEKLNAPMVASTSRVNASATNSNLINVSAYHLFGNAKQEVVAQKKVINAPETRLRLNLKGVFSSSKPKEALAIIASSKGKDKTYHIGDKVVGGAALHAVYDDRVILKRNGKLETLSLPKSKIDSKEFYNKPVSNKARSSSNNIISSPPNSKHNQSQSKQLREMRETLLKEPAKIWQQIRINPVMKGGEVQGYTLAHNDQKLMKALSLRKTDIITAVNGQSLSDPSTLYGLMETLSEQPSLELSIERDGQPQVIQLTF